LSMLLRAEYLVDAISLNQVRGLPFGAEELADAIRNVALGIETEPVEGARA